MPQINLCFLWHMHQPFYKDLASGEYKLPWTRMHALKDYYGMVRILEDFPKVKQTFNLVPSMMAQVEEYAAGQARDPFLDLALKPAEHLTEDEREHLLQHSFYSDPAHMIYRYPRYGELFDARAAQKKSGARNVITGAPARRSPYFNLVEARSDGTVGLSKVAEPPIVRRQDAPRCFDMNASIYAWRVAAFLENPSVFYQDTQLFEMPEERSVDIDSDLDFTLVELLLRKRLAFTETTS